MWLKLQRSNDVTLFRSATELMKQYWGFRKSQIENLGILATDINTLLDILVQWLDKNSKISAPERVISSCSKKAIEAFKSHNILQEQNGTISFYHQNYLDFLIAQHLLSQIDEDGSILDWLGNRERQTLFRREQLRLTLTLLIDESPAKFLELVKQILLSRDIRFHLKHLALELIGQVEDIPIALADYCLVLLQDINWKQHVLETIFEGNLHFIQMLIARGIIPEWLNSGNEEMINRALKLLRSVSNKIPDTVTEQLESFLSKGEEWLKRINNTINWNINHDSERMFELRLKLIQNGIMPPYINWKSLVSLSPFRAIHIFDSILTFWDLDEAIIYPSTQKTQVRDCYELCALFNIADNFPEEIWKMLISHIKH